MPPDLLSRIASDETHDVIVISHCDKDGISFPEYKKDAPLQSNAKFEIVAQFANAKPYVNMGLAKRFGQQYGG